MFLSVFFLRNSLQFKKVSLPLQPQTRNNGAIAQLVEPVSYTHLTLPTSDLV